MTRRSLPPHRLVTARRQIRSIGCIVRRKAIDVTAEAGRHRVTSSIEANLRGPPVHGHSGAGQCGRAGLRRQHHRQSIPNLAIVARPAPTRYVPCKCVCVCVASATAPNGCIHNANDNATIAKNAQTHTHTQLRGDHRSVRMLREHFSQGCWCCRVGNAFSISSYHFQEAFARTGLDHDSSRIGFRL